MYLEFLPLVNAARVVLLDDADLLRELRGLERRRGTSGRDRVDHAPGHHDDIANSAAGALVLAMSGHVTPESVIRFVHRSVAESTRGSPWQNGEAWDDDDDRDEEYVF